VRRSAFTNYVIVETRAVTNSPPNLFLLNAPDQSVLLCAVKYSASLENVNGFNFPDFLSAGCV
jgi:hypothetical protein